MLGRLVVVVCVIVGGGGGGGLGEQVCCWPRSKSLPGGCSSARTSRPAYLQAASCLPGTALLPPPSTPHPTPPLLQPRLQPRPHPYPHPFSSPSNQTRCLPAALQAIQNAGAVLLQREIPEVVNVIFAKAGVGFCFIYTFV